MKSFMLSIQQIFLEKLDFILGFVILFLMPQLAAFIAVGCLVCIDFFTGIWSSYKKGERIRSARMKDTVVKFLMYNVFIITCMITQKYLTPRIPFVEVGLGIIATVETKSIFENIESVLGIKIITAFKEALQKGKNQKNDSNS